MLGPVVESAAPPIASRGVPQIYADRMASDRVAIARQRGGSPETESAVQAALRWLAINQSADGRWDANKFGAGHESAVLGQNRDGAGAKADSAVTGLALLAFLGAGNTHVQGDYAKNVQRGLEFLIGIQGADGNLAGEAETFAYMYSHGMATLAMSEAYAMTGDKRLEPTVQKAINYTLRAQIRATGGWRYQAIEKPAERGDTSQLGWQLMSVKSAELAGLQVPGSAADGAVTIFEKRCIRLVRRQSKLSAWRSTQPNDDRRGAGLQAVSGNGPRESGQQRGGRLSDEPTARRRQNQFVLLVLRHAGYVSAPRRILAALERGVAKHLGQPPTRRWR